MYTLSRKFSQLKKSFYGTSSFRLLRDRMYLFFLITKKYADYKNTNII